MKKRRKTSKEVAAIAGEVLRGLSGIPESWPIHRVGSYELRSVDSEKQVVVQCLVKVCTVADLRALCGVVTADKPKRGKGTRP